MPKQVKVHMRAPGGYLCGVGRRWSSQQITSTHNEDKITCYNCIRVIANRRKGKGMNKPYVGMMVLAKSDANGCRHHTDLE